MKIEILKTIFEIGGHSMRRAKRVPIQSNDLDPRVAVTCLIVSTN